MFAYRVRTTMHSALSAVFCLFFVLATVAGLPSGNLLASEQTGQPHSDKTYLAPVDGPYRIMVIGDSLGNGVWRGLNEAFRGDRGVDIIRKSRVSTGLVRDDYFNWHDALEIILSEEKVQIAVVVFGTNDKQAIRASVGHFRAGSPEWQAEYARRVDRIMTQLRTRNIAIYWVGLPIMRSRSFSDHANRVNEIVRKSAQRHGVKFIETWDEFVDGSGQYSAYGPDISGRTRLLRMDDGIHFTGPGDRRYAFTVERLIREDIKRLDARRQQRSDLGAPTGAARQTDAISGNFATISGSD